MSGLFGALVTGAMGGYAKKPDVPGAAYVDPTQSQRDSISGNRQALPGLEDLGSEVNSYNLGERAKMLKAGIPGYSDITRLGSDALASELRGEIPPDVANAILRRSNAKAYAGGFNDSGMSSNLDARDLGLTSLDLIRTGQSAAPGWLSALNNLAVPDQFNVQSGFMSPQARLGADQWNETNRYSRDWLQNQLDALPDPETAAIAQGMGDQVDAIASMIPYFGAVYSKGMGGGGGNPGGGGGGGMDISSIMSMVGGFM